MDASCSLKESSERRCFFEETNTTSSIDDLVVREYYLHALSKTFF